jgi:putative membrane protein
MGIIVGWVVCAVGLWVATQVLKGFQIRGGVGSYLLVALLFSVLNFLLGWLLSLLLVVGSLGLALLPILRFIAQLFVGAVMLKLVDGLSERLQIASFRVAFIAAFILSVVQGLANLIQR